VCGVTVLVELELDPEEEFDEVDGELPDVAEPSSEE
jgi:hypothetical protein